VLEGGLVSVEGPAVDLESQFLFRKRDVDDIAAHRVIRLPARDLGGAEQPDQQSLGLRPRTVCGFTQELVCESSSVSARIACLGRLQLLETDATLQRAVHDRSAAGDGHRFQHGERNGGDAKIPAECDID